MHCKRSEAHRKLTFSYKLRGSDGLCSGLNLLQRENCRAILAAPMNRLLTTLLVWLLMAALPLHAVAASVSMSCAPVQQQSNAVEMADHASHAAADDSHAHHGVHAMDSAETAADGDASDTKAGKLSHSSCSACSAFCIGAVAPPSSSLSVPSFDGSEAVIVAPADLVAGFIPDGLQRPPRQ